MKSSKLLHILWLICLVTYFYMATSMYFYSFWNRYFYSMNFYKHYWEYDRCSRVTAWGFGQTAAIHDPFHIKRYNNNKKKNIKSRSVVLVLIMRRSLTFLAVLSCNAITQAPLSPAAPPTSSLRKCHARMSCIFHWPLTASRSNTTHQI